MPDYNTAKIEASLGCFYARGLQGVLADPSGVSDGFSILAVSLSALSSLVLSTLLLMI